MAQRGPSHVSHDGPRTLAKTSTMADFRLIDLKKRMQVKRAGSGAGAGNMGSPEWDPV
jgi:hypothetical protein